MAGPCISGRWKAQQPFCRHRRLFCLVLPPTPTNHFMVSWVNPKNKPFSKISWKEILCLWEKKPGEDRLRLLGQRAKEERTVRGQWLWNPLVKTFLPWPLAQLWGRSCTQLIKYLHCFGWAVSSLVSSASLGPSQAGAQSAVGVRAKVWESHQVVKTRRAVPG